MTGTDRTLYLSRAGTSPVHAVFHPAGGKTQHHVGVVFCPPFGWDEVCSYRSRRVWAQRLSADGYPSIRPTYPSTGDSAGGPHDPARLDAWTDAIAHAAAWLRDETGIPRVVAIGMSLGGLIAYRATATGAPIDDLVLWGTPARGRAWVRELTAFSKLELASFFDGIDQPPAVDDGELEAGGFLLGNETVRALSALDLTELPLPDAHGRRALLLDRDGIAVDHRLAEQLVRASVAVEIGSGAGYAAMTSHPQQARAPLSVIERVASWLEHSPHVPVGARMPEPRVEATSAARLSLESGIVVETPIVIEQRFGRLAAVLAAPEQPNPAAAGLCAVLLNAGAVRRIGPNRMWVEAARRWAAAGIPTLRLDIEGLGDSDGDPSPYAADAGLYVPELVPQVLAALDELERRGAGWRFVLGGLCAGAYWSLHGTLQDPRVVAALMINPRAIVWDPDLLPARDLRKLFSSEASLAKIRRQASVPRMRAIAHYVVTGPSRSLARRAQANAEDEATIIERLRSSGKHALLVFAENEPLQDELASSGALEQLEQMPNVTIRYIRVRDHTLRPCRIQREAHELLDQGLERELSSASQGLIQIAASE
jgi:pimeloyl-ACP methyl ester carboxylesterase